MMMAFMISRSLTARDWSGLTANGKNYLIQPNLQSCDKQLLKLRTPARQPIITSKAFITAQHAGSRCFVQRQSLNREPDGQAFTSRSINGTSFKKKIAAFPKKLVQRSYVHVVTHILDMYLMMDLSRLV